MMKNILFLFSILLFTGCATLELYPVEGPLANNPPVPVIKAKAHISWSGNTGKITLTLPDGEVCKGRWSSINGLDDTYTNYGMMVTYGEELNFMVPRAHENRGYAVLLGSKGTSIDIEFLTSSNHRHGYGVGKDNQGNLYKILF